MAKTKTKTKSKPKKQPGKKTAAKATKKKSRKSATTNKAVRKLAPKKIEAPAATSGSALEELNHVRVGDRVPGFEIAATGDKKVTAADWKGKNVVLYFYPKDSTPGCTQEGLDFTRLHPQFQKAGTEVYGVSRDTIKSHEKFKTNQKYSVDLLSDESEELCQLFGVIKMKNMYGRLVRGIERSTFVIGGDGRLVKEWRKVKVPGHAEEVLEFVKSL